MRNLLKKLTWANARFYTWLGSAFACGISCVVVIVLIAIKLCRDTPYAGTFLAIAVFGAILAALLGKKDYEEF